METVKVKTEGSYFSHNVKKNKSIDLVLKMPYSMLTNYVQSIQMLNEDVSTVVKIGADKKPVKLGTFRIQSINIDNDGEGKIKLNSQLDFIDADKINMLASRNDEPLKVLLQCDVQSDEDEEGESEDDIEEDEDEE